MWAGLGVHDRTEWVFMMDQNWCSPSAEYAWQTSWAILCVGLAFLGLSGLIHLFQRQLKDTGRELSLSEKKYWYWVNEFADGRSSVVVQT